MSIPTKNYGPEFLAALAADIPAPDGAPTMSSEHMRALREFEDAPKNMERVPAELEFVARMKLREANALLPLIEAPTAQVNLRSQHPLAKWAAKARAEKKHKAKIAAASRRRNRHGQR